VSVDSPTVLGQFAKTNNLRHLVLSDARRQMLPAYGAMVTDEKSPMYRFGKRAYFILDRGGIVRWMRVQQNPLELIQPAEVLSVVTKLAS
jgi:peroxiredoxin